MTAQEKNITRNHIQNFADWLKDNEYGGIVIDGIAYDPHELMEEYLESL